MTITVESNGLEFSFPDGTTTEQISESLGEYFRTNPPREKESDIWTGLKKGATELVEGLTGEGLGGVLFAGVPQQVAQQVKQSDPVAYSWLTTPGAESAAMPAPKTGWGKVAEIAPQIAASIPGWEFGVEAAAPAAERAAEVVGNKALQWVVDKAIRGAGGTLGGDFTSGESATPGSVGAGAAANVVMEGIFHTPQALRIMKTLLAKNGEAIQEAADHIGVNPSMGVTSGRAWIRTLENLIQKVPGGHLLNIQNAKSLATMDSFIQGIKNKLGYKGDTSALGNEIKQAIENAEKTFNTETDKAYTELEKRLPRGQKTNTRRFTRLIEEMNGVNPQDGIHQMSVPPIARRYFDYIEKAGKIPQSSGYSNVPMLISQARDTLKLLDDYIGTGEAATADAAAAKRMAKALREDIGQQYAAMGLGAEWNAAQEAYASGLAMLERARSVFGRAETGDAIYTRLFGGESGAFSAKGIDTLAPLKKVMTPDEWNHLTAEIVHRLGLEGAGTAGAEGRAFSPSVFLTNWNKLAEPVKDMMFEPGHRYDLDQLAKLSEGFKNLGRDANNSNTAHHMAAMAMAGMAFNPVLWPKLAAILAGSTLSAKLLINPKAARLLVDAAYATEPNQVQRVITAMVAMAAANPDLADEFAKLGDEQ